MEIHKNHARRRETVCGIEYDNMKELSDFILKQTTGHWKKVTCKKCHNERKYYENRVNRKPQS